MVVVDDHRNGSFDVLRVIAIAMVWGSHGIYEGWWPQIASFHYQWALGLHAVDIFFVLSGFLITGVLIDSKAKNCPIWHFIGRRALRILPAFYITLLAISFLHYARLSASRPHWTLWVYWYNWYLSKDHVVGGNPMVLHLWSLCVEEQFYLVWPFIIYFVTHHPLATRGGGNGGKVPVMR